MASVVLIPGGLRRKEIRGAKRVIRLRAAQMVDRFPFLVILDELDDPVHPALHLTDGLPEDTARDDWLSAMPNGGGQKWLSP
jgi:hypothetical protein